MAKRYIDAEELCRRINECWETNDIDKGRVIQQVIDRVITPIVVGTPTADVVPIKEVFRLIAGHSNYHGDSILSALGCVAEGQEVKPIKPLTDFVEICRCEKCKYRITHTCAITGIETLFCDYGEKPVVVEPTHYCGYGERRTDDESRCR